ncbi:hypothetical protein BC827DRAFT_954146 [Russula dissimulans]|nr:hypothetical protein BC827DRAFT_954146 [Russula dissimulans]
MRQGCASVTMESMTLGAFKLHVPHAQSGRSSYVGYWFRGSGAINVMPPISQQPGYHRQSFDVGGHMTVHGLLICHLTRCHKQCCFCPLTPALSPFRLIVTMVNFHDPGVLIADYWAFIKLCQTLGGLYLWEFFINLDYEWGVIRGRYPYRWTIWIYSLTRLATLMAVILDLLIINVATTNCEVWFKIGFAFGNLTISLASLLILLRIVAIWNKSRPVIGLAAGLWVTNASSLIVGISRIQATSVPVCTVLNLKNARFSSIFMLVSDVALLLTVLIGLLRMCHPWKGGFGLGRLLWKQGITWLLLAILSELTPTVFIFLDLNDVFDAMFLVPSLIAMSICATRMYHSLADSGSTDVECREPAENWSHCHRYQLHYYHVHSAKPD